MGETDAILIAISNPYVPLVNGGWGDWTSWGSCSRTCGGGRSTRKRRCNNPQPSSGGQQCSDDDSESRECNTHSCRGTYLITHQVQTLKDIMFLLFLIIISW